MHKKILSAVLLAFVLPFAGPQPLLAQEVRASIGGRVTDPHGAVVPAAAVVVISDETNVKLQTGTNEQGNWIVQFLVAGRYRFTITAPGFKVTERSGLVLQAADKKLIDVELELGSSAQSVQVTAEAPLIDTTSATSGTVVTTEQIMEMPSASHVVTLLATLSPGVIAQDQNNNVVRMWSVLGASQFLADGGRGVQSNSFELDGLPNVKSGGYVSFIPPMDSVQEFRVQTNAYDASIGRQAGATINMQTRSGGKAYHGTLYEFNQNNFLNANLFQTNLAGGSKPPIHFNEYGGTLGGPVRIPKLYNGKEKTFFFVSVDKTHNIDPRPGNTRSVPTDLERKGDFTQSFTTSAGQRFPIQVFDPLTVNAAGNRTVFPASLIPNNRLSPIAQNILKYVPLPNIAGDPGSNASNNYVSGSTRQVTFPVVSTRGDHMWNNAHRSFAAVRWSHLHEYFDNWFGNRATGNYHERIAENVGLDHIWTLSTNKVLDLRASVSRFQEPNYDNGTGFDPLQLGLPSSFVSQLQVPSFPRITGFAGDFGTGEAGAYTNTTYWTWSASLAHVRGNHTMRYGAEYWVLQEANVSLGNQGQFDFSNVWTRSNATVGGGTGVGSTFGSYLLGLPSGGNVPVNASSMLSQRFAGFYFQDDWRVTPRLTLNLGMRWDYERPVIERFDRLTTNYDLTVLNPISGAAQAAYAQILSAPANAGNAAIQALQQIVPAGAFRVPGAQLFVGVGGQPRTATNYDLHEWQPRAGFAYRIGAQTVVRGGFGRFTQATFFNGGQNGFSRSTTLIASQDNNFTPYDTLAAPFHSGILAPTGSSLGPLTNLGQGISWNEQNADRPYSWEYSLHLQHQWKSWLFEAGYSHNKTYNIGQGRTQDNPSLAVWKQLRSPQFDATGKPVDQLVWDMQVPNPFRALANVTGSIASSASVAMNRLLYGNPLLGAISKGNIPLGENQYDALLVKVEHRFSNGFSILNAFTWSKLMEDTSLIGPEIAGPFVEHKLGGEDRPLHLSIAPIWELPFGRGKRIGRSAKEPLNALIGGWQLAGQYNIQSGVPVVFGTESFFDGKNFALPRDQQTLSRWFDTSHFLPYPSRNMDISGYPAWTGIQSLPGYNYKPAASDTIRNGVYNDFATTVRSYPTRWGSVRASRVNDVNLTLSKAFRFRERIKLQLRFEAFNALNHPRFGGPSTDPASANFGRVSPSQQNSARTIQLGGRLSF